MTSVNRCGDDGCPCRNLPAEVDQGDTERLRAENAELRARLAGLRELADSEAVRGNEAEAKIERVEALPHEDWCCAKGCAGPGFCAGCAGTEADCRCLVATVHGLLDQEVPQ